MALLTTAICYQVPAVVGGFDMVKVLVCLMVNESVHRAISLSCMGWEGGYQAPDMKHIDLLTVLFIQREIVKSDRPSIEEGGISMNLNVESLGKFIALFEVPNLSVENCIGKLYPSAVGSM